MYSFVKKITVDITTGTAKDPSVVGVVCHKI